MNKELIELQRGCSATCVVILEDHYKELGQVFVMDANISDENLFAKPLGNPIFKEKLDSISSNNNLMYFVIRGISEIKEELQNRYVGLVKDREFGGYSLPDNVILVFTVKTREELQKISKELYHFCVIAFQE
jgi:hypothetical protein